MFEIRRIFVISSIVWRELIRKKDFYVLLVLVCAAMFWMFSIDTFSMTSPTRYLADVGLLLVWLCSLVLSVMLGARQIPNEEARGTIFSMLSKPLSRAEFLAGKWIGVWIAASFSTLCFYVAVYTVIAIRGVFPSAVPVFQAWLLHIFALSIVVSLSIALSTKLSFGAAATISFVLLAANFMFVPKIPSLILNTDGIRSSVMLALYYAMPHLEVFDMRRRLIHDWGCAPWDAVALALFYALCVSCAIMVIAWLVYRRKRFSRGTA